MPEFLRVIDGPPRRGRHARKLAGPVLYPASLHRGGCHPSSLPARGSVCWIYVRLRGGRPPTSPTSWRTGAASWPWTGTKAVSELSSEICTVRHTRNVLVVAGGRQVVCPTERCFDRVLVDAPCSAEGTLRRKRGFAEGADGQVPKAGAPAAGGAAPASHRPYPPGRYNTLLHLHIRPRRERGCRRSCSEGCSRHPRSNHHRRSTCSWADLLPGSAVSTTASPVPAGSTPTISIQEDCSWHVSSGSTRMNPPAPTPDNAAELPGWSPVPAVFPDGRTDPAAAAEMIEAGFDRLESLFGIGADVRSDFGWIVRGEDLWAHRCGSWPLGSWGESDRWRVVSVGLRAMVPDYRNRPRPTKRSLSPSGEGGPAQTRLALGGSMGEAPER